MSDSSLKGWMKRATSALLLLLGIAFGARLIYLWLMPVLPLLTWLLVLIGIYAMIFGFTRRL